MKNTHWRCASRFRPVSTRLTLGFMETIRSRALTHVSAMRWSNRNRSITIAGARAREPSAHAGRAHTSPLCHQPRCTHVILPTDGTSITMPFILPTPPPSPPPSLLPPCSCRHVCDAQLLELGVLDARHVVRPRAVGPLLLHQHVHPLSSTDVAVARGKAKLLQWGGADTKYTDT